MTFLQNRCMNEDYRVFKISMVILYKYVKEIINCSPTCSTAQAATECKCFKKKLFHDITDFFCLFPLNSSTGAGTLSVCSVLYVAHFRIRHRAWNVIDLGLLGLLFLRIVYLLFHRARIVTHGGLCAISDTQRPRRQQAPEYTGRRELDKEKKITTTKTIRPFRSTGANLRRKWY